MGACTLTNVQAVIYTIGMTKQRETSQSAFRISLHAAQRYVERFAGNITVSMATARLEHILRNARRKRPAAGGATVYGTHGLEAVVKDGIVLTVYFSSTRPAPYAIEA